jgi:hypothetical protein
MKRIVNVKYYDNDEKKMIEAVRDIGTAGGRFIVGGHTSKSKDVKETKGEGEDEREEQQ